MYMQQLMIRIKQDQRMIIKCNVIYVINKGKIIEAGNHEELLYLIVSMQRCGNIKCYKINSITHGFIALLPSMVKYGYKYY